VKKVFFTALLFFFLAIPRSFAQELVRSGCCSHHGGVTADGCGCNDGTPLSSACAPYYTCNSGQPNTVVEQNFPPTEVSVYPTSKPTKVPTIKPTSKPKLTKKPVKKVLPKPTKKPAKKKYKKTNPNPEKFLE
jgi:hypothetical protein